MEPVHGFSCTLSGECNNACKVIPDQVKTLEEMQAEVGQFCQDKGWRENPVSFGEAIALLHSEVSEALEAYRDDSWNRNADSTHTVEMEFADIFIRLLDDCQIFGIDLRAAYEAKMEYNRKRPYRHGGKLL